VRPGNNCLESHAGLLFSPKGRSVRTRGHGEMAVTVGLGQLRNHACAYFERVMAGETLYVVRRGKLVARIVTTAGDPKTCSSAGLPFAAVTQHSGNRVGLPEVRTRAGRLIDRVADGEIIEVAWRQRVVARMVSIDQNPNDPDRLRSRPGDSKRSRPVTAVRSGSRNCAAPSAVAIASCTEESPELSAARRCRQPLQLPKTLRSRTRRKGPNATT
jgi:antitoxin (DNA-binding transcriptional repressor) of toxin-antitoxin stability system